ncbi:MAG: site-specific DNA-methyltransferase [Helicobacteraceae bacterium]|jgi:adenine-specific DNA-methyltransferase|nr:site-specific DNA-methyltransferase [Helicobacteraceae bacterium]
MDKLKLRTPDLVERNFATLAALFPNAVTETIAGYEKDKNGDDIIAKPIIERAIDADILAQEINAHIVSGKEERYQFTWPDKKKSILLANAPIAATLRPYREESVDFDNTENLYIEGDNLDVLKLLRETYLNRVKMIYIDPPYNTGNDFIYNDDFAEDTDEFLARDGQYDEDGNRMIPNLDSNGRFHTNWLNMIYPRLRIAKDLLRDDGVIFISIDDSEVENLKKICNETFGASNFRNTILTRRRIKSLNSQFADNGLFSMNVGFEYVLIYAKSPSFLMKAIRMKKENSSKKGRWDVFWSNADRPTMRYDLLGFTPMTGQWRNSKEKADIAVANYQKYINEFSNTMTLEEYYEKTGVGEYIRRIPDGYGKNGGVQHWVAPSDSSLRTSNWTDIEVSQISKEIDLPFDNPKSKQLIIELIRVSGANADDIILDFFSGSATTAHAVMQLNAEDGGKRKFIMVQLPESCDEKSEAYRAGYKNICEIGKERIRRAGANIKDEIKIANKQIKLGEEPKQAPDIGFRVLKLDSGNMKDIYCTPQEYFERTQGALDGLIDNIKPDRTHEDLLFSVMLDFGILLSSKIEVLKINGRAVYNVEDNYLLACFEAVDNDTVTILAQMKPRYAVFRDSSFANDSALVNFEQIFKTYSPTTIRKVL